MELVLTNARVVTPDTVIDGGSVLCRDGRVVDVCAGRSAVAGAVDLKGDYLLPGLVDLHTDNLERHMIPRVSVYWPASAAILAHDRQVLAGGITTVLDSLALGDVLPDGERVKIYSQSIEAWLAARRSGATKAYHALHLRCEIGHEGVIEPLEALRNNPDLLMVSVMDHTPGQRQFMDLKKYRFQYPQLTEQEFLDYVAQRQAIRDTVGVRHRRAIIDFADSLGIPVASHDDRTEAEVAEAVADGIAMSEFPTALEAARAAHRSGMAVIGGAPNVVLGGSHSGNASVADMARAGVLDILASDYVPASMILAAFALHRDLGIGLAACIAMVSAAPADAVKLADRGRIALGQRADLVRVRHYDGLPVVETVWRDGQRVL